MGLRTGFEIIHATHQTQHYYQLCLDEGQDKSYKPLVVSGTSSIHIGINVATTQEAKPLRQGQNTRILERRSRRCSHLNSSSSVVQIERYWQEWDEINRDIMPDTDDVRVKWYLQSAWVLC